MKPGKFQIRFADILQHARQIIYIAVLIYIIIYTVYIYISSHHLSVYFCICRCRHNKQRDTQRFHQSLPGEDADAAAKQLQDREQKVEDQVGRSRKGRLVGPKNERFYHFTPPKWWWFTKGIPRLFQENPG